MEGSSDDLQWWSDASHAFDLDHVLPMTSKATVSTLPKNCLAKQTALYLPQKRNLAFQSVIIELSTTNTKSLAKHQISWGSTRDKR